MRRRTAARSRRGGRPPRGSAAASTAATPARTPRRPRGSGEEGREAPPVPGEIPSALSAGTTALLRLGAAPLLTADDALAALGLEREPRAPPRAEGAPGGGRA